MKKLVAVAAVMTGLFASPALASVEQIRLHVRGLACPFCVFGIEKNLKKLPGVASVETTIRTGLVRLQIEPGAGLDTARLEQAVVKSGFTLDGIEATVTGRLVSRDEWPALEAEPGGQIFLLVEGRGPLSTETLQKLKRASRDGSIPLTVSGRVHGHASRPPSLAVQSFEAAR